MRMQLSHQIPHYSTNVNGTLYSQKSYKMGGVAEADFFLKPEESHDRTEKKRVGAASQPQRLVLK